VEEDQTTTSGSNNQNTQMELSRTYTEEGKHKHHKASFRMNSIHRDKKRRSPRNIWHRMLTCKIHTIPIFPLKNQSAMKWSQICRRIELCMTEIILCVEINLYYSIFS
jgi:hypothetical protein